VRSNRKSLEGASKAAAARGSKASSEGAKPKRKGRRKSQSGLTAEAIAAAEVANAASAPPPITTYAANLSPDS
jgi:hypothetical protein